MTSQSQLSRSPAGARAGRAVRAQFLVLRIRPPVLERQLRLLQLHPQVDRVIDARSKECQLALQRAGGTAVKGGKQVTFGRVVIDPDLEPFHPDIETAARVSHE